MIETPRPKGQAAGIASIKDVGLGRCAQMTRHVLSARRTALDAIRAGDVIFASGARDQGELLLVLQVDADGFHVRNVASQVTRQFGRDGKAEGSDPDLAITSTAALTQKDYETALGLDKKARTGRRYPDFVLSSDEIKLLLNYETFCRAHPLPE